MIIFDRADQLNRERKYPIKRTEDQQILDRMLASQGPPPAHGAAGTFCAAVGCWAILVLLYHRFGAVKLSLGILGFVALLYLARALYAWRKRTRDLPAHALNIANGEGAK